MRRFAFGMMTLAALMVGCNEPVETIPSVSPSSGTTVLEDDHGHAEGDHEHAEGMHEHAEGMHEHAEGMHEHAEGEHADEVVVPPAELENDLEEGVDTEATETDEVIEIEADEVDGEPSAAAGSTELIRFVADKKISVPSMMCPYSCWPKVKETLAAQPGVEGVQLAEQPQTAAEGEIVERVVELKLNDDFDADKAVAALANANFEAEMVN